VEERLPGLRDELRIDFCIVNGENAADGRGLTPKLADRLSWQVPSFQVCRVNEASLPPNR